MANLPPLHPSMTSLSMNLRNASLFIAAAGGLAFGPLLSASAGPGREPLPIFDAHVHYSQPAWSGYPPAAVQEKLKAAGVLRALVSSTPDGGTLTLVRAGPARFVAVLRPYRGDVGLGNWINDDHTPAYIARRLDLSPQRGVSYRGIGEFHLSSPEDARAAVVRKVARMAVRREIVLHVHAGAEPVAALFEVEPRLKVLWAHAGMVTPPEEIRRMMDAHPRLWAEVSFRAGDILAGERLDTAWKSLLRDHSGRFLIGSDTYVPSRWAEYGQLIAEHRRWLSLLPPGTARAIAYRNAVRLFGSGGIGALER